MSSTAENCAAAGFVCVCVLACLVDGGSPPSTPRVWTTYCPRNRDQLQCWRFRHQGRVGAPDFWQGSSQSCANLTGNCVYIWEHKCYHLIHRDTGSIDKLVVVLTWHAITSSIALRRCWALTRHLSSSLLLQFVISVGHLSHNITHLAWGVLHSNCSVCFMAGVVVRHCSNLVQLSVVISVPGAFLTSDLWYQQDMFPPLPQWMFAEHPL